MAAAAVLCTAPAFAQPSPPAEPSAGAAPTVTERSWLVEAGQTLFSIARALGPDDPASQRRIRAELFAANPDAFVDGDPGQLRAGARLVLPGEAGPSPSSAQPAGALAQTRDGYWLVKPGETLYSIARALAPDDSAAQRVLRTDLFLLNPDAFVNNDAGQLLPGSRLLIPDYEPPPARTAPAPAPAAAVVPGEAAPSASSSSGPMAHGDAPPHGADGYDAVLAELERLNSQGDAEAAYALATRHLAEMEGDPYFDYRYGVAAIDSGHASEGVFALERVLLAFPEDDRARLELGRGYFLLQEYARAQTEFVAVLKKKPPEAVQATVNGYLDAIRLRETRSRTSSAAYVELGFGYDTNVNSAPPDADFLVPSLPGFQARLDPLATAQADWFGQIAAGGQVVTPYAAGRSLYFGGDINQRLNVEQNEFDTGWVTGRTGWNGLFGNNRFRAGLQAQYFQLDYKDYRDLFGINGDWRHNLNARNELIGFVSADVLRYPSQSIRNSTLYNLGGAWKRLFEAKYRPELLVSLYGGYENPDSSQESAQAIAQRNIVGARVTGRFIPTGRLSVYGSGGYQRSHYIGTDILFQTQRTDNFYSLEAGFTYLLARHWSLRGDLYYYDNQSNIFLNDYDRTWGLLRVRYDWF